MALEITFTNTSSGDIIANEWDFGDGGTSNVANPIHTYSAPGTYSVTLTVYGADGSVSSFTEEVTAEDGFAHLFDFTIDEQGWFQSPISNLGIYVPGVGWQQENGGTFINSLTMQYDGLFDDRVITAITLFSFYVQSPGFTYSYIQAATLRLNGVNGDSASITDSSPTPGDYETLLPGLLSQLANDIWIRLHSQDVSTPVDPADLSILYAMVVEGEGTDPFVAPTWQQAIDFTVTNYLFTATSGEYTPGVGWQSTDSGGGSTEIRLSAIVGLGTFTLMRFTFIVDQTISGEYEVNGYQEITDNTSIFETNQLTPPDQDNNGDYTLQLDGFSAFVDVINLLLYFDDDSQTHGLTLVSMYFEGEGDNPFPQYQWEHQIDFELTDGGFTGLGNYVPGVGWEGVDDGGAVALGLNVGVDTTDFVYQAVIIDVARIPDSGASSDVLSRLGGAGGDQDLFVSATIPNGSQFYEQGFAPFSTDLLVLGMSFGGAIATEGNITFKSVTYRGNGVDPFL